MPLHPSSRPGRLTGLYDLRQSAWPWRLRYILEVQVETRGVISWRDADGADICNLKMKGFIGGHGERLPMSPPPPASDD